ncbi:MAG: NAD(P)-binding domain-containing protein [Pseudomonadota bacterium]
MKIGIIGAGGIGQLYARLWSARGHDVMLSSRNPDKIIDAAAAVGAKTGTAATAAAFGDVVVLAVNYWTVDQAIDAITPHIEGKLIIDTTNPLQYNANGGVERVIAEDELAAAIMMAKLPAARIAKAFTTLWTGHVEKHSDVDAPTTAMPYAADDDVDRQTVAGLISDAGLVPVDLGTIAQSRLLDPPSPIWNVVLSADELRARASKSVRGNR